MIALTLLAAAALIHAPGDSLHGTVRVAGVGEGIPGVQVSVRGHVEVVLTDFAGRYVLHNLRGDRLALRFERLGFQPLTVDVMVGDGGGAGVMWTSHRRLSPSRPWPSSRSIPQHLLRSRTL